MKTLAIGLWFTLMFLSFIAGADGWLECRQRADDEYQKCVQSSDKPVDVTICMNKKGKRDMECKKLPYDDGKEGEGKL